MSSNSADNPQNFPLKPPTTITPVFSVPEVESPNLTLWQRGMMFLEQQPKLAVLVSGLAITTLSLATWLGALYLENKILKTQLGQSSHLPEITEDASVLKARITETQEQLTQLKTQLEQQQTEEMMDSREALISENARLLQELNQLSKPQLGAPLVKLDPASLKLAQTAAANSNLKADPFTPVDVPHQLALFTVVLHQTQDQGFQSYFVELTDGKGKTVAWSEQLKGASFPDIPLTFAKRSHAPGKYQLKLHGINGKKKEFIDHYDLQLNYLAEPAAKKTGKKK
jgi:hypothetical protein